VWIKRSGTVRFGSNLRVSGLIGLARGRYCLTNLEKISLFVLSQSIVIARGSFASVGVPFRVARVD